MSHTKLVVNADDLGLAESVNRGIADTIESGVVTSTSLMVNMAACDDAVRKLRYLRAVGKSFSVGLHFNVVAGRPLTSCPSLVDASTGCFLPLSSLIWKSLSRTLNLGDVQRELDAQLRRIEDVLAKLSMRVTHIDSHRHTHCLPGVFDLMLATARERGITHVRHPYETRMLLRRPRAIIASKLLRIILHKQRPMDDVIFTGVGAMASPTFQRDISAMLGELPSGTTELMVHPGYDSAELGAIDGYREPREREVHALTSPRLRERIHELGVELTRFGVSTTQPA